MRITTSPVVTLKLVTDREVEIVLVQQRLLGNTIVRACIYWLTTPIV